MFKVAGSDSGSLDPPAPGPTEVLEVARNCSGAQCVRPSRPEFCSGLEDAMAAGQQRRSATGSAATLLFDNGSIKWFTSSMVCRRPPKVAGSASGYVWRRSCSGCTSSEHPMGRGRRSGGPLRQCLFQRSDAMTFLGRSGFVAGGIVTGLRRW